MTIHVNPNDPISDLQNAFTAVYPHLKLQFFSKAHGESKGSFAKFLIHDRSTLLSALNPELRTSSISIAPDTITWALEKNFEEAFLLHVQVFRQSGSIWLETSVSDHLTLAEQEAKGAKSTITAEAEPTNEEQNDYHEQE